MIAFWAGLPLAIRLFSLAIAGAAAGGLANCILFACGNVGNLENPWAPPSSGAPPSSADARRRRLDRLPIVGWIRMRRSIDQGHTAFWWGPLLLEIVFAAGLPLYYWCESNVGGIVPAAIGFWMQTPLAIRYGVLAVIGLLAGGFANYIIYTHAHLPRPISPWAPASEQAPPRRASDRIPLLGWFGLRREAAIHGRGFWIRPLLIEFALAAALPLLYWFETQVGGQLPQTAQGNVAFLNWFEPAATQIFLGHAILCLLMVCATFIDFDEQTIPDLITIPGTLIALGFGMTVMSRPPGPFAIGCLLPTTLPVCELPKEIRPTTFDAPWFELVFANGPWSQIWGLWTATAIWSGWCFALADRRFSRIVLRRRGISAACKFFCAGLFHYWTWRVLVALWVAGLLSIAVVWGTGGNAWYGLFSSLVGLAIGGGTIWAIRIVASWAMDMEAMGFGDVTLMAMVGAFVGWQAAVLGFFLSPFAAIVIVLIQYVVTRNRHVPFGPYLCAGTLLTLLAWESIYNGWLACNLLMLWPMLQWLALTCLGLMGVMLFAIRLVRTFFAVPGEG